jgi:hypothetical protein
VSRWCSSGCVHEGCGGVHHWLLTEDFFNAVFHNTVTVTIFTRIDDDNYIKRGLKILKSPTAHYELFRTGTDDYFGSSFYSDFTQYAIHDDKDDFYGSNFPRFSHKRYGRPTAHF